MTKDQKKIRIGILSADKLDFFLKGGYTCNGAKADGSFFAAMINGKIMCYGQKYDFVEFKAVGKDACFTLKNVTFGVDFHWQSKEDQIFKGDLRLLAKDNKIIVMNHIGLEDYLTSVISSEMSATAPLEFLKAHAVISRSWLLAQIDGSVSSSEGKKDSVEELITWQDHEDHEFFDVCADDHCQRYQGITKISTKAAREAVKATWGEVLMFDDQLCDARFSKCCGGQTELFESCWGKADVPYLQSFDDPFCNTSDPEILGMVLPDCDKKTTDFFRWEVKYSTDELSEIVRNRTGIDYGDIQSLEPIDRGPSGRITRLKIVGSLRTRIIGKELEIRHTLSPSHLYSSAFDVEKTDDGFVLHGRGWGHGVGLCQIGAAVMGTKGYSYKEILNFYYRGAEIQSY